jgi:hypothetical protein
MPGIEPPEPIGKDLYDLPPDEYCERKACQGLVELALPKDRSVALLLRA